MRWSRRSARPASRRGRGWSEPVRAAAVLLAAGASSRMGRAKALLPWRGRPLAAWQAEQLAEHCGEVVVVLGSRAGSVGGAVAGLPRTRTVINDDWEAGRAGSIRAGVAALGPTADAVVIAGVDQPINAATIAALLDLLDAEPAACIAVPRHGGRNGHPPCFRAALVPELLAVDEATEGLRAVHRRHADATAFVDLDDPTVLLDLNTPRDYDRALR